MEKYKITHELKKAFVISEKEKFNKGSLVYVPKRYNKFNANVFFLTFAGHIKMMDRICLVYSKDFFKPFNKWFKKYKSK